MLLHLWPEGVTCADFEQSLYAFSERELDARVLLAYDQHLLGCAACRQLFAGYRGSNEVVKRHMTREIRLPREFGEALVRTLRAQPA